MNYKSTNEKGKRKYFRPALSFSIYFILLRPTIRNIKRWGFLNALFLTLMKLIWEQENLNNHSSPYILYSMIYILTLQELFNMIFLLGKYQEVFSLIINTFQPAYQTEESIIP